MTDATQSELYAAAVGRLYGRLADVAMEAAGVYCSGTFSVAVVDATTVYVTDSSHRDKVIGSIQYLPFGVYSHVWGGTPALASPKDIDDPAFQAGELQRHVDAVISTWQKETRDD